ncbi:MAG: LSm family protein [Nanoarchaeota archaeon]
MTNDSDRPLDALNHSRGKRVIIDLKNGKQYVGTLKAFDIHINTVLDNAEERESNQLLRKIGTIFIRGDAIVLISTE